MLSGRKKDHPVIRTTFIVLGLMGLADSLSLCQKLFFLEFENEDYTKKSYQKVESYVHALNLKSPSKKYKHDKAHRTLFIYKNPSTMKSIMDKVNENISGIGNWFLFKTYEEVFSPESKNSTPEKNSERNFMVGWRAANGEITSLY